MSEKKIMEMIRVLGYRFSNVPRDNISWVKEHTGCLYVGQPFSKRRKKRKLGPVGPVAFAPKNTLPLTKCMLEPRRGILKVGPMGPALLIKRNF